MVLGFGWWVGVAEWLLSLLYFVNLQEIVGYGYFFLSTTHVVDLLNDETFELK